MKTYGSISITKIEDGSDGRGILGQPRELYYLSTDNKNAPPILNNGELFQIFDENGNQIGGWTDSFYDWDDEWTEVPYIWTTTETEWTTGEKTYEPDPAKLLSEIEAATVFSQKANLSLGDWCRIKNITIIDGSTIMTGTITAKQLSVDIIKSNNYISGSGEDENGNPILIPPLDEEGIQIPYSEQGTFLDLSTASIYARNFGINGETGDAYFAGTINTNQLVGDKINANLIDTTGLKADTIEVKDNADNIIFRASAPDHEVYAANLSSISANLGTVTAGSIQSTDYCNEDGIAIWSQIKTSQGLEYALSGDETYYIVTGIGDCTDTNLIIPMKHNGLLVKEIGYKAFYDCINLTGLTIGYNITSIGTDAFYNCSSLTEVVIPDSVTSLGDGVFYNCSNLAKIVISNNIASIGNSAFYGCNSLTEITIPNSVTSIGDYAFYDCSGLTSITIPDSVTSISTNAFRNCSNLISITIGDGVTSIDNNMFNNCSSLTNITIGNSVTSIGAQAFYNCSGLKSITIPNGITIINAGAFYRCSNLTEIVIPVSINEIKAAFQECVALKNIYYMGTETDWNAITVNSSDVCLLNAKIYYYKEETPQDAGCYWHYNDNNQIEIWVCSASDTKKYLESSSENDGIYVTDINNVPPIITISSEFYSEPNDAIGEEAFNGCDSLISVIISNGIIYIRDYAFQSCRNLTSVSIGNDVIEIGHWAFEYCDSLTSITIPDSVTSIGIGAFEGCYSLTSVVIGNSVTSIVARAFYDCNKLTSVYYKGTEEDWNKISIGNDNSYLTNATRYYYSETEPALNADSTDYNGNYWHYNENNEPTLWSLRDSYFTYRLLDDGTYSIVATDVNTIPNIVSIPSRYNNRDVTAIGNDAFSGCKNLTKIIIPNNIVSIGTGVFTQCKGLTSVTIGDGVTLIDEYTFAYCDNLTHVVIGDNVTTIGYAAFWGCSSLTEITIPDSVTTIGSAAFSSCSSLTSVIIGNGVTSIGSSAFQNCSSLTSITIPDSVTSIGDSVFYNCSSLTSVTIPDSVTSIGYFAFYGCSNLTRVVIGSSVTSIYMFAFEGCTSLKSVYYAGDQNNWSKISVGIGNEPLTNSTIYYYSETRPETLGDYWHEQNGFKISCEDNMIDSEHFKVSSNGQIYANNGIFNGEIYAKNGTIGNLVIRGGGLSSINNDIKLNNAGLILEKTSSKIQVGDLTLGYNTAENTTLIETSGHLIIRGQNDTQFELMKDTSATIASSDVTLYFYRANTDISAGLFNANVWLVATTAPLYPVTYNIEWQAWDNGIIGNGKVIDTGIVSITLDSGETTSSEVQFSYSYQASAGVNFLKKDGSWTSLVRDTNITSLGVVNNFYQVESPSHLYLKGNLLPTTDSESDDKPGYNLGSGSNRWNTIFARNSTIQTSDRKEKRDIKLLDVKYENLFDNLLPVSYKFITNNNNRTHIGLIAQDVKEAVENAGLTTQDFAGYCEWVNKDESIGCGLRYGEFVALCIDQIQKLKKRVEELENNTK